LFIVDPLIVGGLARPLRGAAFWLAVGRVGRLLPARLMIGSRRPAMVTVLCRGNQNNLPNPTLPLA
jgi:hypothetical protein